MHYVSAVTAIIIVLASTLPVFADPEPSEVQVGRSERGSQTSPRATSPPDLLRGAIDPFEEGPQRARFLRAAGVDSELSEQEFKSDAQRAENFIRAFDRWNAILRFDRDGSGTIDWFEVQDYRREMRKHVLTRFDVDRNGRLNGGEREAANGALGSIELLIRPEDTVLTLAATPRVQRPNIPPASVTVSLQNDPFIQKLRQEIDVDGNGDLSYEELRAHEQVKREHWQQQLETNRRSVLGGFDRNRNGKLDADERQAFLDSLGAGPKRRFDKNNDGRLDEQERSEWEKTSMGRFFKQRAEADVDGDGLLSWEENQAFMRARHPEHFKQQKLFAWAQKLRELRKEADTDGDGLLNERESAQYHRLIAEDDLKTFSDRQHQR